MVQCGIRQYRLQWSAISAALFYNLPSQLCDSHTSFVSVATDHCIPFFLREMNTMSTAFIIWTAIHLSYVIVHVKRQNFAALTLDLCNNDASGVRRNGCLPHLSLLTKLSLHLDVHVDLCLPHSPPSLQVWPTLEIALHRHIGIKGVFFVLFSPKMHSRDCPWFRHDPLHNNPALWLGTSPGQGASLGTSVSY